ncbi:hypothetical protein BpHYR1_013689 [Brachionus plicatilis]|uniref:Uncharacterized protein n=1 Tax=Brachionus plicatilis TaxID=10195 RepID=A0A3M7RTE7_BRAPC|nr:hypothetical protein BpHYR1_013689 [Brachionus plicatilis]
MGVIFQYKSMNLITDFWQRNFFKKKPKFNTFLKCAKKIFFRPPLKNYLFVVFTYADYEFGVENLILRYRGHYFVKLVSIKRIIYRLYIQSRLSSVSGCLKHEKSFLEILDLKKLQFLIRIKPNFVCTHRAWSAIITNKIISLNSESVTFLELLRYEQIKF